MFHHCVGQIECCDQFCARLFPDLHRVADVIRMTVRDQNEIDILERSDFVLRIFENRIREPRIDEQNFSAWCNDFKSRLTVPSELRVHANHEIEKNPFGKGWWRGLAATFGYRSTASLAFCHSSSVRHSSFIVLSMLRAMNHAHAHRHISKSHPRMAHLIRNSQRYAITPPVSLRPFDALAESIAYQQLNGKAAATIWGTGPRALSKNKMARPRKSSRHTG